MDKRWITNGCEIYRYMYKQIDRFIKTLTIMKLKRKVFEYLFWHDKKRYKCELGNYNIIEFIIDLYFQIIYYRLIHAK